MISAKVRRMGSSLWFNGHCMTTSRTMFSSQESSMSNRLGEWKSMDKGVMTTPFTFPQECVYTQLLSSVPKRESGCQLSRSTCTPTSR
ncbi:hypothetical protein GDO81_013518 [Engystomops pustulosus]|uniref:Uncharacterized protein n=1 Tax=Engystomops pustulosus TaxID=76066 RepID=A0AAV7B4T3_ENGPU|nr:hypothetical protein GDO81_013518 [Engystomops pustulosus]